MGKKIRVLILDPDGSIQRVLKNATIPAEWELVISATSDVAELRPPLHEAEVLVAKNAAVTSAELEKAPRLRLIQKFGRRTENIDLETVQARGIQISTMPLEHGVWVAEHALMLMLALTKRLIQAHTGVVAGTNAKGIQPFRTSQSRSTYNWTGVEGRGALFRKVLGIIGLGEIGTEVALRAKSFCMEILYYNPPAFRLAAAAEAELGVTYCPVEEMLPKADFVTLHIPHTEETEGLMGAKQFALMKSSAYFINCSRGGVVDERALCEALAQRRIAGAGLDVFEFEPLPQDSGLTRLDNVVMTPHLAGGPLEAIAAEGQELVTMLAQGISDWGLAQ